MLRYQSVSDRLASVALLDADHQTLKIINVMHVGMAVRIDDQGLTGDHIWRAKVRHLFTLGGDRRAGCNAVVGAVIEASENAFVVRALKPDQLPLAAKKLRNALH